MMLGITKTRTKQIVLKYVKDQAVRTKYFARSDAVHAKTLIMKDETFVPIDPLDVPGRKFYHSIRL